MSTFHITIRIHDKLVIGMTGLASDAQTVRVHTHTPLDNYD